MTTTTLASADGLRVVTAPAPSAGSAFLEELDAQLRLAHDDLDRAQAEHDLSRAEDALGRIADLRELACRNGLPSQERRAS